MRKWKGWGAALVLAICAGSAAASSQQPSEEQVRQLMDVVGVGKMLSQMNTQAVTMMQQSLPCIPASYWQNYLDANRTQQFIGRLVPVYQHHFTADEIEGMLKFYRSPLGQKVINEMPATMAEANQAGQQWSKERSDQMIAELKQAGSLDGSGRCPAANKAPAIAGATTVTGMAAAGAGAQADDEEDGGQDDAPPAKPAAKKAAAHGKTKAKPKAKSTAKKSTAKPAAKATAKPAAAQQPDKAASATPTKPAASS
jgi:hypothetical protein